MSQAYLFTRVGWLIALHLSLSRNSWAKFYFPNNGRGSCPSITRCQTISQFTEKPYFFLVGYAPSGPGSFYMLPGGALKCRITDWHDAKNTSKGLTKFFKWFGLLCQIESDVSSRMLASLSSLTGRLVLLFLQPKSTSMHVLKESLEMFGYRWPTWVLLLSRALLSGPRFLTDMYK